MSNEPEHQPERVLWSGHQSHWYFLGHWIVGLFIVAALAAGLYFYRLNLNPWMPWAYGVPILALLVVMAAVAFKRRERTYRVTNHRVISIQGMPTSSSTRLAERTKCVIWFEAYRVEK